MNDFWVSSGHLLLDRDAGGGLLVTDEFLKAYLARPELMPPEEACAAERALHAKLMARPQATVSPMEIAAIVDADARENWELMLAFRDRLLAAPTLEAAYGRLIRDGVARVPPLFLNQLAHVIMRNALDGCDDAFVARAGELFYRPQRVSVHEGKVLLADAEVIEGHEMNRQASPLLAMLGGPAVCELDVLTRANADDYWGRSDAHDMVLDLGGEPGGRAAIAGALERWLRQIHGFDVTVEAVERIEDADWRWFVGLDAEATVIGNALWRGEAVDEERLNRVLALFRLTMDPAVPVLPQAAGRPVYLLLAMGPDRMLRMKPQNLVTGLPVAEAATAN
ncbi:DUF6352 family protein [Chelatococcus sp. SYSU_G07232]|uniref:DUF6352 family protein n=1 Tax=Chelatococcus albus TaxID=3047466 RepID=A0ABT7AJS2_9HYPH|nr:DUF6352 family protein [Chelatococcus sp. SYSU_G07232]MDJ1159614.1 DUF6352 family protein [Chelatococcus sp. SYSU_G07232]